MLEDLSKASRSLKCEFCADLISAVLDEIPKDWQAVLFVLSIP